MSAGSCSTGMPVTPFYQHIFFLSALVVDTRKTLEDKHPSSILVQYTIVGTGKRLSILQPVHPLLCSPSTRQAPLI